MEIWNSDWCGTSHGPLIEIPTKNGNSLRTRWKNEVYKGNELAWDNFNGFLGAVSGLKAVGQRLQFRIIGYDSDDFCPKRLRVKTYDGTVYQSSEMDDWVDNAKGGHIRYAYKI